jgi:hypothetical protein
MGGSVTGPFLGASASQVRGKPDFTPTEPPLQATRGFQVFLCPRVRSGWEGLAKRTARPAGKLPKSPFQLCDWPVDRQPHGTWFTAKPVWGLDGSVILGFFVWFVFLVPFPPVVAQVFAGCFSQKAKLHDRRANCLPNAIGSGGEEPKSVAGDADWGEP